MLNSFVVEIALDIKMLTARRIFHGLPKADVNFSLCDAYYVEILFAANKMSYKITFEAFFVATVM
jgi:hypothetical protein